MESAMLVIVSFLKTLVVTGTYSLLRLPGIVIVVGVVVGWESYNGMFSIPEG